MQFGSKQYQKKSIHCAEPGGAFLIFDFLSEKPTPMDPAPWILGVQRKAGVHCLGGSLQMILGGGGRTHFKQQYCPSFLAHMSVQSFELRRFHQDVHPLLRLPPLVVACKFSSPFEIERHGSLGWIWWCGSPCPFVGTSCHQSAGLESRTQKPSER